MEEPLQMVPEKPAVLITPNAITHQRGVGSGGIRMPRGTTTILINAGFFLHHPRNSSPLTPSMLSPSSGRRKQQPQQQAPGTLIQGVPMPPLSNEADLHQRSGWLNILKQLPSWSVPLSNQLSQSNHQQYWSIQRFHYLVQGRS
jgi:hypothetical protein